MERQDGATGAGLTFEDMTEQNGGTLPLLSVPSIMLSVMIAPVPLLWILTLPFGFVFWLLGHPLVGVASTLASMAADWLVQRYYRRLRLLPDAEGDSSLNRIAVALIARAGVAMVAPVFIVIQRPGAAELAFLGVVGCLLLCVATAQGHLSRRLFWASGAPVLIGIAIAIVAALPPREAAALLLATGMLTCMLGVVGGGAARVLGDWTAMRARNNELIDRLRAEREEAEKAREEARLAGQSKANFLATMSHEIRTPMNGVLGMAQLLKRTARGGEQHAQIDTLIQSGEFLMSILNDILDISKIDAGALDIAAEPEDLRLVLDDLARFWRPTAEAKGLALEMRVADDVPAYVSMDARRVRQILFNLIGNALKFTGEGGVVVSVEARPIDNATVELHIAVSDTGIGIDADILPALFERFSQADQSSSRQFGGAGLGLAISRQLGDLMGGRLWAESEPGQGACFHLTLPLAVTAAPLADAGDGTCEDADDARRLSILIVDDNPVNLTVLNQILCALGHEVVQAGDGPTALALAGARPFDLILLDIQMPGMNGMEVLEALRAEPGPNGDSRVVAVTADVLSRDRQAYLSLGFCGHVSKPIQVRGLADEITGVMSGPGPVRAAA